MEVDVLLSGQKRSESYEARSDAEAHRATVYLENKRFSEAATACHRAYQNQLMATVLKEEGL